MTEQEAKWYRVGSSVNPKGTYGPTLREVVIGHSCYDPGNNAWQVETQDSQGSVQLWVLNSTLELTSIGMTVAEYMHPAQPAAVPHYPGLNLSHSNFGTAPGKAEGVPQYDISTDTMKPVEPSRPLCPVEGERETVDWDAHCRFMRGLR